MTLIPESMTDALRRRLLEGIACPTCHQPLPGESTRKLADAMGMTHTGLWRFLKGGDMTGRNLDKVDAYLKALER